eukprot:30935-Pelagococcus_subviridis.AAC.13
MSFWRPPSRLGDKVEVVFRRDVVVPSKLFEELNAVVPHGLVRHDHVLGDRVPEPRGHVQVFQEHLRHRPKRVLRPRLKPIDHGVVDHPGEVPTARPERVSHRGHPEDDVEVVPAPVDEVVPRGFFRLAEAFLDDFFFEAGGDAFFFVVRVQRGNHPAREHVVDELQEPLIRDVRRLEVVSEHRLVVPAREGDFKHLAPGGERGESRQRLLPRPADADEQRVSLIEPNDAMHARQVLERVLEEHEVHVFVLTVVVRHDLLEQGLDIRVRADVFVQAQHPSGGVAFAARLRDFFRSFLVVAEEDRVLENIVRVGLDDGLVLLGNQPVVEDSQDFVSPQSDELRRGLELVLGRAQEAFVHPREVSEVEDVVETTRRRGKFLENVVVQLERDVREIFRGAANVLVELHRVRL